MKILVLVFLCLFEENYTLPVIKDKNAIVYLQKFGYLEKINYESSSSSLVNVENVVKALKDFQRFAGLKQTGEMNEQTVTMMNVPRCGVKDIVGHAALTRKKRYAHQGSKWMINHLTYTISKYPYRPNDRQQIDEEIARAFKVWTDITGLTFEEKKQGEVNIDIRFENGEHGDGDPFDGQGKTLAHAFFPHFGGDIHFDNEEIWTINQRLGTNLFQVAAHEFGHSLGLGHSDDQAALMAPYYRGFQPTFKLDNDDIAAIQSLYGTGFTIFRGPDFMKGAFGAQTNGAPDLCQDSSIDTATRTQDRNSYVFKGDYYWRVTENGISAGYPRRIADDWDNLEGNLDASLTWISGKTYFFKGGRYWRFTNKNRDPGYPLLIRDGFKGIPDNLDAALFWNENGKPYFFKGDKYWRYDDNSDPPVSEIYPMPISHWEGIPNNIDATFQWENTNSYFFKGKEYYRFDGDINALHTGKPDYPRPTSTWWFGC